MCKSQLMLFLSPEVVLNSVAQLCLTLWSLQHARLPCPSPTPRVYSNSCPLSWWCHPTISSSVVPFSSCLQSFPASGSFLMSQSLASGGRRIGVSASASGLPMNIQDWFPLRWTSWISLQSNGLSRVFFNTMVQKHQFFGAQRSLWSNSHIHTSHNFNYRVQLSHLYITTRKTIALTIPTSYGIWEKVNTLYLLC